MKKSQLERPGVKQKLVKELAVGKSQNVIAKENMISQASVSRFANRAEIKEMIEKQAMRLIESVPDAVANMQTLVRELRTLPKKDHKNRELSYRATVKVLEAPGILNTPNASPTIINFVQQNNIQIDAHVQALAGKFLPALPEAETVDVDYSIDDGV